MGERSRETNSPVSAYSRRSLAQPWGVCKALFPDYFAGFRLVDYRPMLLYMPIVAALASGAGAVAPRRFGAALLGGWIGGAAANVVYGLVAYTENASAAVPALVVAGCLLLALLVL